jgi:hypothetical protein
MCGIAGFLRDDEDGPPVDPDAALREAARRLRHRGPDGEGFLPGRAGRPRPHAARHHRSRGRRSTHGQRDGRDPPRPERRAVRLRATARRARGPRAPLPHPLRRGDRAPSLRGGGPRARPEPPGHVRAGDLGRAPSPARPGAGPAGAEAARVRAARRNALLRLGARRPSRPRRWRRGNRRGGPRALPRPRLRAAAAVDRARHREAPPGRAARRRGGPRAAGALLDAPGRTVDRRRPGGARRPARGAARGGGPAASGRRRPPRRVSSPGGSTPWPSSRSPPRPAGGSGRSPCGAPSPSTTSPRPPAAWPTASGRITSRCRRRKWAPTRRWPSTVSTGSPSATPPPCPRGRSPVPPGGASASPSPATAATSSSPATRGTASVSAWPGCPPSSPASDASCRVARGGCSVSPASRPGAGPSRCGTS